MWRRFRPDPDEFQSAVNLLCSKIQTIALRSGMSHVDCDDIERASPLWKTRSVTA